MGGTGIILQSSLMKNIYLSHIWSLFRSYRISKSGYVNACLLALIISRLDSQSKFQMLRAANDF